MDDRELIIAYYDLYQNLLTDKQRLYFEDYYYNDFSLSEIAENYEVSRNAVFDLIKKACNNLYDYENKLHLYDKILKIKKVDLSSEELDVILSILED